MPLRAELALYLPTLNDAAIVEVHWLVTQIRANPANLRLVPSTTAMAPRPLVLLEV